MTGKSLALGAVAATVVIAIGALAMRPHDPPPTNPFSKVKEKETEPAVPSTVVPGPPAAEARTTDGTLVLLGSVQPESQVAVSARMPARIASVSVREGERVRAGAILVQLDDRDVVVQERNADAAIQAARAQLTKARLGKDSAIGKAQADLLQAQASARQAQAKVSQALLARDAAKLENRADVQMAEAAVRKAQVGFDRATETLDGLRKLAEVGGVSRSDLQGARAQVDVAAADLATAKEQLRRAKAVPSGDPPGSSYRLKAAEVDVRAAQAGVEVANAMLHLASDDVEQERKLSDQDIASAAAALKQAEAGRQGAQAMDATLRMVSPIEGIVSSVAARAGETAQPGMPLVNVVSMRGLHVEALVPSRELSRIRPGMRVTVTVDTNPGRRMAGTVSSIAQVAEPDGRTFKVKFAIPEYATILRPGQNARVGVGR